MTNHPSQLRLVFTSLIIIFALTSASIGVAQSGRRVRKPTLAPSTPEPTPTPAVSTDKRKPALKFIVGIDRFDSFAAVPMSGYDGVLRNCVDKLDEPASVDVEVARSDMSRSDAINRAKSEKEGYVVWLQIRVDNMSSRRTGDPNNAYLEYAVFEPTTAKTATSGATYPGAQRKGNVILGRRTSDMYNDHLLNQAARQAADRILAHFRVGLLPDRRF